MMHVACHYEVIEKPKILSSKILAHTLRQSPATCLTSSHLGYKYESQDEGSANEEPSAEESGKCIDKILQGVGSNDNDCEHNAGDVNGCCNILGIIKALDLHLAS